MRSGEQMGALGKCQLPSNPGMPASSSAQLCKRQMHSDQRQEGTCTDPTVCFIGRVGL